MQRESLPSSPDPARIQWLAERELQRFVRRTPGSAKLLQRGRMHMPCGVPMAWMSGLLQHPTLFAARGTRAGFVDVDGNEYLDFNLCDLSLTVGFQNAEVSRAMQAQLHAGVQFLLPTEISIELSEALAQRSGMPYWQYTLSASGANLEAIRLARAYTGRTKIVVFDGKYHGHVDDTLVALHEGRAVPELRGVAPAVVADAVIVPFNDRSALASALGGKDVALVLMEPVMTNCTLVLPDPGFLKFTAELARSKGTLLCMDEAHTFQLAYGGLVGAWDLDTDLVTLGKGLGSGVAFGAWGMTDVLARFCNEHLDFDMGAERGLATGGTLFANPLSLCAAHAALTCVLTREGHERVDRLGSQLADGIDAVCARARLGGRAFRLGPRSGVCMSPVLPRNAAEASASIDLTLIAARRVFMANRGIWDAMAHAGPQVSFAHDESDVQRYVAVLAEFFEELCASPSDSGSRA